MEAHEISLDLELNNRVGIIQIEVNSELQFVLLLQVLASGRTQMKVITDEVSDPPEITIIESAAI
jgi:hypothetical protein